MFQSILRKVFGTSHERQLKRIQPKVAAISDLEPKMQKLSDEQLAKRTVEFKEKLANGSPLDDLLIPAFATAREAGKRVLGMRHYDVQMIGGTVLHEGKIAEMKTGEGKTLVATLACYLNALEGKGVHVVTVNDYLAARDAEWMGRLYNFLGLSVGVVAPQQGDAAKRAAYRADITYGQNNEFGFDYLRDNMKFSIFEYAQRELNFAIVDEVDSILIDEARTPLIISGQAEVASDKYVQVAEIIPKLRRDEHYIVDEKFFSVTLTEAGMEASQVMLRERGITKVENLYDPVNLQTLHILQKSLQAHTLYKRDQHYMVSGDGKVMIIDEFRGRVLAGRRWSDGLHQAVEAKEGVTILPENRTLATISFQNLFRLYKKLSGMTGTADTEASEFQKIYKLDVVVIPTNRKIQRADSDDLVYKSEKAKFNAVAEQIIESHERGQPVLVGTTSVEKSEALARVLERRGVPFNVLNAKQHEQEAYVVAQAGRKGAVTVSTNMAGRGTDILLGGNPEMLGRLEVMRRIATDESYRGNFATPESVEEAVASEQKALEAVCAAEKKEVVELGGLQIIGTERHESRRIDNQLRGRAGRQGDPGASRFYLSLEDELMRRFGGDRMTAMMERLGMEEDVPIEHPWVTRAVENAQKKVEEMNFDSRKNLLEYDDVMNQQRKAIYALRRQVLEGSYRGLQTDEERKAGVAAKSFVTEADSSLYDRAKNALEELVKLHSAPLPVDYDPMRGVPVQWRDDALKQTLGSGKILRPADLERDVYEMFGTRISVDEWKDDPIALHKSVSKAIGLSLTEQRERLFDLIDEVVGNLVEKYCPPGKHFEDWNKKGLEAAYRDVFAMPVTKLDDLADAELIAQRLYRDAEAVTVKKMKDMGPDTFLRAFRNYFLREIDRQWLEHLNAMEHLRDGIGLRGYGQRDPKKEYKKEGYEIFVRMMAAMKDKVVSSVFRIEVLRDEDIRRLEDQRRREVDAQQNRMQASHPATAGGGDEPEGDQDLQAPNARGVRRQAPAGRKPSGSNPPVAARPAIKQDPVKRDKPKVGRNDPCYCGSGKKYKSCHMRTDETGASETPE